MTCDPLSDVLRALGARGVRGTRLEASGAWALSFQGTGRLKFVAVLEGRCWLLLPGMPPETVERGDVFLLSDTPFTVASDPAVVPTDGMRLYDGPGQDTVRLGTGAETVLRGGGSTFADGESAFVLDALPAFLRIDAASPGAGSVARILGLLEEEIGERRLGASLVTERLAEILVVEAIRAYVATGLAGHVGWISALSDPRIGAAIRLMHGEVARPWTGPMLAAAVGMSRSAFTQLFLSRVGRPPIDYLTCWRMVLARRKLSGGCVSVAHVAAEVGYSSQAAFAHAFKRTLGHTPRSTR